MNKLATALILFSFVGVLFLHWFNSKPLKVGTFDKPYTVTIINEHEVLCISGKDTVKLFFENAYVLHEETIVFITK